MSFSKKVFFWVIAGLLVCSGSAFAKGLRGKITGVNTKQNFLIVQSLEESKKPAQTLMLMASNETRWDGVKSLKDLGVGDEVTYDASKEKSGAWKLKTLSRKPSKTTPAAEVSSRGGGAAMAMGGYSGN